MQIRPLYRLFEGLGQLLRDNLKQPREALTVFMQGFLSHPHRVHLLLESARCRADLGKKAGCLRDCRQAVQLAKQHYFRVPNEINQTIAQLLRKRLKAPQECFIYLTAAIRRNPDEPFLKILMGYALQDLKQYRKAAHWHKQALRQYRKGRIPHSLRYYLSLTYILLSKLEKPADALQWLEKANAIYPDHPDIILRRGLAYGKLKQFEKQVKAYKEYIRLQRKCRKPIPIWIKRHLKRSLKKAAGK